MIPHWDIMIDADRSYKRPVRNKVIWKAPKGLTPCLWTVEHQLGAQQVYTLSTKHQLAIYKPQYVRSFCKKCSLYSLAVLYFLRAWVRNSGDCSHPQKSHLYASIISGARYHRVATYSVKCEAFSSGVSSKPLLRPKSQILSSQSAFTRRFPGLRSRCMTPAEWINFIPWAQSTECLTV